MAEIVPLGNESFWNESELARVCARWPDQGTRPGAGTVLRRLIDLERQYQDDPHWLGGEWRDLGTSPQRLMSLEMAGLVRVEYSSNRHTGYRVNDPDRMEVALAQAAETGLERPEATIPADLFSLIEGHDQIKEVLRRAIETTLPVHVLLVGPPATAKSMFMAELGRLPGSRYAVGGSTSRAGIIEYLVESPDCRFLLLDEMDKAEGRDLSALLSVMEAGRVTRMLYGRMESVERQVSVFAGANSTRKLPRELLSRFFVLDCPSYGPDEYRRVAISVLIRRENVAPDNAAEIAGMLAGVSQDIRDAVRLARLSGGEPQLARRFLPLLSTKP